MSSEKKVVKSSAHKKIVKQVKVCSEEGDIFEVEEEAALFTNMIKKRTNKVVNLSMVPSKVMPKLIDYTKYHWAARKRKTAQAIRRSWDAAFVAEFDLDMFNDVLVAAEQLEMKLLLDMLCKHLKSMDPEETIRTFNIKSEFEPVEAEDEEDEEDDPEATSSDQTL